MKPWSGLIRQPSQPDSDIGRHERIGALLVAAQQGDRDALTQLVRTLTPLLWHVARSQGLDSS